MKSWLRSIKLVIISAQSYCETREHDYPVAELSAITFSLQHGIISKQHFLIDHRIDEWPDVETYNNACLTGIISYIVLTYIFAENETGIPVEARRMSRGYRLRNDYDEIIQQLVQVIRDSDCKLKFVLRKQWNVVMGAFAWLKGVRKVEGS